MVSRTIDSPVSNGTPLCISVASVRHFDLGDEVAKQRHAQKTLIPAIAADGIGERPCHPEGSENQRGNEQQPVAAQELSGPEHDARCHRQRLSGLVENLFELRHNEHHENRNRQDGYRHQNPRVDQCRDNAFAQLLGALQVIGETTQHVGLGAARFAGTHHVDVEARKHVAMLVQCFR